MGFWRPVSSVDKGDATETQQLTSGTDRLVVGMGDNQGDVLRAQGDHRGRGEIAEESIGLECSHGLRIPRAGSRLGKPARIKNNMLPMSAPTSVPLIRTYCRSRPTWSSITSATLRPSQLATTPAM